MKFRTVSRHLAGRLGLIAAIAAFGMSAAVQADPASAAPPDSGLGAQGAGDGPVGPSGCRGDCQSSAPACGPGVSQPCVDVPTVELTPEQRAAWYIAQRCRGLGPAACRAQQHWMDDTPAPSPQGPGYGLPPIPPGANVPATPPREIKTTGRDKITGQRVSDPAADAALGARIEASLAKQCSDDPASPACDHVAEAHCMFNTTDAACDTGGDQVDCDVNPDDPACQADEAPADDAGADNGLADAAADNADNGGAADGGDMNVIDDGGGMADDGQ